MRRININLIALILILMQSGNIFAASNPIAQNNNDEDLLIKFSREEIVMLKKENINEYNFLKACTKNAFYITSVPHKKINNGGVKVSNVNIPNIDNINFHELNIEIKEKNYQYFIINNGNKLLVVKSKEDILKNK